MLFPQVRVFVDPTLLYQQLTTTVMPHIGWSSDERRAIIFNTFYGTKLIDDIVFEGSNLDYTSRLIDYLLRMSQVVQSDERPIIILLESLKQFVGIDVQARFEELKIEINHALDNRVFSFKKAGSMNNSQPHSILGQHLEDAQYQCDVFMVMPFREHLNPVFTDHIKPVIESLDLKIKRGDDPFSQHDIITEIWSLINNSHIVIADCTGKNPNVFYEMGLAHAIDKPVVLIAQDIEDIPFDIRHRRVIKYEYTPRGMKQFEEELKKAIRRILGKDD